MSYEEELKREELLRNIDRQLQRMTTRQLEMFLYELSTKEYES